MSALQKSGDLASVIQMEGSRGLGQKNAFVLVHKASSSQSIDDSPTQEQMWSAGRGRRWVRQKE